MSTLNKPHSIKLVIAFFSQDIAFLDKTEEILIKKYGRVDYKSSDLAFTETNYYSREMGQGLKLRFISFEKLLNKNSLPFVKLFTCKIERKLSLKKDAGIIRQVNIDPGFLSFENFILATGKGRAHRIYLDKGVWADLTLIYKKSLKSYSELPWTYPNYQGNEIISILNQIRVIYHGNLKKL